MDDSNGENMAIAACQRGTFPSPAIPALRSSSSAPSNRASASSASSAKSVPLRCMSQPVTAVWSGRHHRQTPT
ncbi:unnamed protein product [Zymoseptoria tritici ST99CH_1E4]|uniref:Uncharacterized protein n=1 Tax=Zymoseptoria tritici ST99CH_1E4 TaxID=1276532 RepID=A0A2H1H9T1_ZYMTR|nr:unnamed protein product [Zymoseptoria tritici ST99CH_1E4]